MTTQNELIVLAAVLGGTNMGMALPSQKEVKRLIDGQPIDIDQAVMSLWSSYMESDEVYDAFMQECKWWLNDRSNLNKGKSKSADPAYVRKVWPDVAKVMGWSK